MTESNTTAIPPPPRKQRRWLRRLLVAGLVLVVLGGILLGFYHYLHWTADRAMLAADAETDRLDPGWRLHELEARREAIPDEENAALVVLAARKHMPKKWPAPRAEPEEQDPDEPGDPLSLRLTASRKPTTVMDDIRKVQPNVQFYDALAEELRVEMGKARPALAEARRLRHRRWGRYPITYAEDVVSTNLGHLQDARSVANLLWLDAVLLAQEGQPEDALASTWAGFNVGRSIGDEPSAISFLVRIACNHIAVASLERTLAQGQVSEIVLPGLQELLVKEEAETGFLVMARAERAHFQFNMRALDAGKAPVEDSGERFDNTFFGSFAVRGMLLWLKRTYPDCLQYLNRLVAIARMPLEEREVPLEQLVTDAKKQGLILAKLLLPVIAVMAKADPRDKALLRCSIVAIVAERYRLKHNRWPEALDDLVEAIMLEQVPLDPYDGEPLRYRRLINGLVIYSVGPDRTDDDGELDRENLTLEGTDLGFQLWDPDQRRRPGFELLPWPDEELPAK